jgi:hypothetical protein
MTEPTHTQPRPAQPAIPAIGPLAPIALLRAEGLVLLAAAGAAYAYQGHPAWLFALAFLLPDIAMLGYLRGSRLGAALYNLGHTTLLAAPIAFAGWIMAASLPEALGLIWLGHIGFDRLMGYGLKQASAFGDTHLGRHGAGTGPIRAHGRTTHLPI